VFFVIQMLHVWPQLSALRFGLLHLCVVRRHGLPCSFAHAAGCACTPV